MALNLTNIEKAPIADWMLYVFTAIMLLVRVHTVHRQNDWERRGLQYDRGVTWFGLSDGLWFAVAILVMALVLPYNQGFRPLNSVYKLVSSPSGGLSEDFNRLFRRAPGEEAPALPRLQPCSASERDHQEHVKPGVESRVALPTVSESPQL